MTSFQYTSYLQEMFPNKPMATIQNIIDIVISERPHDGVEYQLENIINLLTETRGSGQDDDELLDEAAGISRILSDEELQRYLEQLLNIFPDACPIYISNLCRVKSNAFAELDDFIDHMTNETYPKKQINTAEIYEHLHEMLPNADPTYLQQQAKSLAYQSENELKQFIEQAIENNKYPTMDDYLKTEKETQEIQEYTTSFNIQKFLNKFPDPEKHFSDPQRKSLLAFETAAEAKEYALTFLYNFYCYLRKRDIEKVLLMSSNHLTRTCQKLDAMRRALKVPRCVTEHEKASKCIPLLQEIAYLKNKKNIKKVIKDCDANYRLLKEEARKNNLLQTCACCFDDELIPEECFFCKNSCIFCKDCVKGGTEAAIGDGKLDFPCLADCGSEFSFSTLQMVLDLVVFFRMAQKKQVEEIKQANISDLETCPFCDFATVVSPSDKIFRCLNNDCQKETCRKCRHVAHIPLRCEEIEYDADVKMRTYIENKMTEALLRKCCKCSKVFIKESGCNKMTCTCGAKMCYVCGAAVTDYNHFGGENGSRCPLYTTDLNRFHAEAVIRGANTAKSELGINQNPELLKNDPAKDLADFYTIN